MSNNHPHLLDLLGQDLVLLRLRRQLLLGHHFGSPIQDANRYRQEVMNIQPLRRQRCYVVQRLDRVECCGGCICSLVLVVSSPDRIESICLVCLWPRCSVDPMCEARLWILGEALWKVIVNLFDFGQMDVHVWCIHNSIFGDCDLYIWLISISLCESVLTWMNEVCYMIEVSKEFYISIYGRYDCKLCVMYKGCFKNRKGKGSYWYRYRKKNEVPYIHRLGCLKKFGAVINVKRDALNGAYLNKRSQAVLIDAKLGCREILKQNLIWWLELLLPVDVKDRC